MSVIEALDVSKAYRTPSRTIWALEDVTFAAERGEFVSIMGPSGSGKTTLLNILGLLDSPTDGVVRLDGRRVEDLSIDERTVERRRQLGFVFQDYHLIPTLSALENVELPSVFAEGEPRTDRAERLLRRVGLGDRLHHDPSELSGGQRQRVAIARSLVNEPNVLLADEPTGNLDRRTSRRVLEEFDRLREDEAVAVVAVTHDALVSEVAQRTVELVDGTVAPAGDITLESGRVTR